VQEKAHFFQDGTAAADATMVGERLQDPREGKVLKNQGLNHPDYI